MAEARESPKDKEPVGQKPDGPRSIPTVANNGARTEAPKPRAPTTPEELVITLNGASGDISKIEALEKSGRRRELSAAEFVELADEDGAEDIAALVEEVYRTAVADALGDDEDEKEDEALTLRSALIGRVVVRRMLGRGAKRLLLLRLLS